jgi:hypothetical protein
MINKIKPNTKLTPPNWMTPELTHSPHYKRAIQIPGKRTKEQSEKYKKKVDWFHKAKYGLCFHFLASMGENKNTYEWTSDDWNDCVESVNVDKIADQAKELDAGYVALTIGQNCQYYCAPNPIIEKFWNINPGEFGSRRDLPMDLYKALKKRDIRMFLYTATDNQFMIPCPENLENGNGRYDRWVEAMQWYSDHYGKACSGWWIDGLYEHLGPKGYTEQIHAALRHGNPEALISSGTNRLSDFLHGHSIQSLKQDDWGIQQERMLPYYGRWDPISENQWHVFLFVGSNWGFTDLGHSDESIVSYCGKVIKGGGVITFDIGTRGVGEDWPQIDIPMVQFNQLRLIRDALKEIAASDGFV